MFIVLGFSLSQAVQHFEVFQEIRRNLNVNTNGNEENMHIYMGKVFFSRDTVLASLQSVNVVKSTYDLCIILISF